MSRPKLLDLFCGAGGASMGYHRAGFDVVGVDIHPQPRYPFLFIQADALTFPLIGFDVIHASPCCQAFSRLNARWRKEYPDYIGAIRERIVSQGLPYVMENVPGAPLHNPITLCGSMFGLRVLRHRWFESNRPLYSPCACDHTHSHVVFGDRTSNSETAWRDAMGCEWMRARADARQAIPPAYTEWVGRRLLA